MNTLKIFSILIFALCCFSVSLLIARRFLLKSKDLPQQPFEKLLQLSSAFIGVSIILNLVFRKINYLYDLIDQSLYDFHRILSIGRFNYGFSPEMVKVSTIYLALAFGWVFICVAISKLLSERFFAKNSLDQEILKAVIFICMAVAFYPVLDFILDNFYIVLDKPVIN